MFAYGMVVEFWDAIRDILVVAIPTIIAGVTSYFSVNLWQVKKEKFALKQKKYELRKKIQDDFQVSIAALINYQRKFTEELLDPYITTYRYQTV